MQAASLAASVHPDTTKIPGASFGKTEVIRLRNILFIFHLIGTFQIHFFILASIILGTSI